MCSCNDGMCAKNMLITMDIILKCLSQFYINYKTLNNTSNTFVVKTVIFTNKQFLSDIQVVVCGTDYTTISGHS